MKFIGFQNAEKLVKKYRDQRKEREKLNRLRLDEELKKSEIEHQKEIQKERADIENQKHELMIKLESIRNNRIQAQKERQSHEKESIKRIKELNNKHYLYQLKLRENTDINGKSFSIEKFVCNMYYRCKKVRRD